MKIAIAGYGLEGESSFNYWSQDSNNEILVADQNPINRELPESVKTIIGPDAFDNLYGYDLIIRTAGLHPKKIKTDGKIWSATNEFFAKCPAKIVGVTGTKGKGTTASLIASILEAAGKKVWLLGNIGYPSLDSLPNIKPDDIVVYELSSFQLWDLEKSPHAAVCLLIEPDHLNVHDNFADYVNAKANIRKFQTDDDILVYHPTNVFSKQIADSSTKGKIQRYGIADDGAVYEKEGWFMQLEQKICSLSALQLIGRHNVDNACAALSIVKFLGVSDIDIENGLKSFPGLPHRLEFVRELDGVKYYNDSFSSAPPATLAAIKSFDQPEILILGGTDKGGDFHELAYEVSIRKNIKKIFLIGEMRYNLAKVLGALVGSHEIEIVDDQTLKPIVEQAKKSAVPGDVILLSPGCASFDMFLNFYDRGDQFRAIVNSL